MMLEKSKRNLSPDLSNIFDDELRLFELHGQSENVTLRMKSTFIKKWVIKKRRHGIQHEVNTVIIR
jgi:hypothetical protein